MLRRSSPIERVLTYAIFLAVSLAIHMVLILGPGGRSAADPEPPRTAQGSRP